MQKAKERPNLVHWRDELVAITKDSSEDFEDATLSVELMRARCDVCYHEKAVSMYFVQRQNRLGYTRNHPLLSAGLFELGEVGLFRVSARRRPNPCSFTSATGE